MKRDILLEWHYEHPPEKVWECLTNPQLIAQWLMENDFKPAVGHKFQFRAKPMPGWSGIVDCEVTELVENKLLAYTWKSGPKPGVIKIETLVTWRLEPTGTGTKLTLAHTGWRGMRAWLTSFLLQKGWKGHIAQAMKQIIDQLP